MADQRWSRCGDMVLVLMNVITIHDMKDVKEARQASYIKIASLEESYYSWILMRKRLLRRFSSRYHSGKRWRSVLACSSKAAVILAQHMKHYR